jgi:hypothetical protein
METDSNLDVVTKITFPSRKGDDGKWYTLDGEKELTNSQYVKCIIKGRTDTDLTETEKEYLSVHLKSLLDL